jgi:uncharacterized repeat protein (TIGR01451 family)
MNRSELVSSPRSAKPAGGGALRRGVIAMLAACALTMALMGGVASAQTAGPGWVVDSLATPTNFSTADNPECLETAKSGIPGCDSYQVTATNAGSKATDGSAVTVSDTLPAGLTVQAISFTWSGLPAGVCIAHCGAEANLAELGICTTSGTPVTVSCVFPTETFGLPPIGPDDVLRLALYTTVEGAGGQVSNEATVSGGGAAPASTGPVTNTVGGAAAAFGVSAFTTLAAGPAGAPDREAGAHPYEFSTRIDLNSNLRLSASGTLESTSVQDVKDVVIDLPLGFLGDARATPTCTLAQLSSQKRCPHDTVVGHLFTEPAVVTQINGPIYNLQPEQGEAAEFGFIDALKASHVIYANVAPSPTGYVLQATAGEVPQVSLTSILTTFYGNPALKDGVEGTQTAMFTNPSSCSGEGLTTSLHLDSWQNPGPVGPTGAPELSDPRWKTATSTSPAVSGCNLLQFAPGFSAQPDTSVADSPSGLDVDVTVPQDEEAFSRATPPLRKAVVQLPPGFTLDPSAAQGLGACTLAEIGLGQSSQPTCPPSSKVGTVEVSTPLLPGTLPGSIYLASQNENPFASTVAAYIVIDDPITGTLVKIAGRIELSETGQITGTFDQSPQFPFSDLKLHFFGGDRGDLVTPETCGSYGVSSLLTPWSTPEEEPGAGVGDQFGIASGCVTGFAPSFSAATTSPSAGAFSPFDLSYGRSDADQELAGLSVSLPRGLLAKIAGVGQCSDAALAAAASRPGAAEQANPSCPADSQVGTVTALAGPGPSPFAVQGKVYLTGPILPAEGPDHMGAPYGLAVVVPAIAGPYDLGTVVVRQALEIDPIDAHVTAVSDPFPTVLRVKAANGETDGFPLRMRNVEVTVDRPGFTINPTNCEEKAITGTGTSLGGLGAPLSTRFAVGGCRELGFKPKLTASTQGKTSKAAGASLHIKLVPPHEGPQATSTTGTNASSGVAGSSAQTEEANIAKVKVELPKILPAQLKTLQKACIAHTFEENPAKCPKESIVGMAVAHTPLLSDPLTGPAYFVSHGNEAFPQLVVVLQGENGLVVDLVGDTFINHKTGITSSTFAHVPDVPVSSFELTLPQGKYSALAANGNLCKSKLAMPTEFLAQNGAKINESTKIGVTGCPKVKNAKANAKKGKKSKKSKKGKAKK